MKFKIFPDQIDSFWAIYRIINPFNQQVLFVGVAGSSELLNLRDARQSVKWRQHIPNGVFVEYEIIEIHQNKRDAQNNRYKILRMGEWPPINLGVRSRRKKPVMRISDGRRFEGIKEAAQAAGITPNEMSHYLNGRRPSKAVADGNVYCFCD